jgi:hypothetical protein
MSRDEGESFVAPGCGPGRSHLKQKRRRKQEKKSISR